MLMNYRTSHGLVMIVTELVVEHNKEKAGPPPASMDPLSLSLSLSLYIYIYRLWIHIHQSSLAATQFLGRKVTLMLM
jgi:hypothetical protein